MCHSYTGDGQTRSNAFEFKIIDRLDAIRKIGDVWRDGDGTTAIENA